MAGNFLHHFRVVDEGNHPHLFLADRALQRVDMPRLADQVAPFSKTSKLRLISGFNRDR